MTERPRGELAQEEAAPPARRVPVGALRLAFALLLLAIFGIGIVYLDGLTTAPIKDEEQFWAQIRWFVERWPPDLDQLRSYHEPMPPIAFLIWAALEHWHGLGIAAARLVTLATSLFCLALILRASPARAGETGLPVLCALALLLYPYWVPLSLLIYTDVVATAFVVAGFWLYLRERHWASGLLFALAIGTRQYSITFPLAILAYELLHALRTHQLPRPAWLPQLLSAATLLGWFALFGGPAPAPALERWPRHSLGLSNVDPSFALYFLAALGAYFAVVEFVLERRWRWLAPRIEPGGLLAVGVVALLFAIFPPEYRDQLGPLNRVLVALLGDNPVGASVHLCLLVAFASALVLRLLPLELGAAVVAVNAALMPFLWEPWEKYCMPVLATLWLLKAAGALTRPPDPAAPDSLAPPGLD